MFGFVSRQSLPQQLSAGTLIAVALLMTLLIYFISSYFTAEVNHVASENQSKQVQLVSQNLEARYEAMVESNQTMANMFKAELAGLKRSNQTQYLENGLRVPRLMLGNTILNQDMSLLNDFTEKSGYLVSVYVKHSSRFINIATSIKGEDDKPIIGSEIAFNHKAYNQLLLGNSYQGLSQHYGFPVYQNLIPISANGNVIAIMEVSTNLTEIMTRLSDYVKQLTFGKSGYVYVMAAGENEGDMMIHRTLTGGNVYDIQPAFKDTFKQAFVGDRGEFYYAVPTKGIDSAPRNSKVLYRAVKGWNWVALLKTYEDEYQAEIDAQILKIELMCIAGALFLMLVLWLLIRRSLSPLEEITQGLKMLGEGNLTYQFKYKKDSKTKNEMHLLKRDIAAMRDGLVNVIRQVSDSSKDLADSAESIDSVSHELQHHAKRSEEESSYVSTAIDQVVESIEEVASSTRAVSNETSVASEISISGNDAVQDMEATVATLSESFNAASSRIRDVEDSSNSIGEVVDVINAIAEQTNLLALNAAIEAARAGEQGRGFAVVADEVRVLAQKTQDSTKQIRDVVEKLQSNSQSAVAGMQDGAKQVELSVSKATKAGILLNQIRESIVAVEKSMSQVSNATEEQRLAAQKISDSAKSLTQTSSDTFSHSEFSSDQGQNVKNLSARLLNNISVFKITE